MTLPIIPTALHHPALNTAYEATIQAAVELRRCFRREVFVQAKGLANFVTEADLASERAIVSTIRSSFPNHAFISEESHADRSDAPDLWIIDPLDGTSNFMHQIPHFAISIGYYRKGEPELGIVYNPISKDFYIAVRDQGAWYNGVQQQVSQAAQVDEAMVACGFYYDRGQMMQSTLDTVGAFFRRNVHGVRRFGAAALDLSNVACGQYGLFFEYKLHPWDYAAGQLILSEAGGKATTCDNTPLPLGHSSSICATNGLLHSQALEILSPHWSELKRHNTAMGVDL